MSRTAILAATLVALAAGGGGYLAGREEARLPDLVETARASFQQWTGGARPQEATAAAATGPVVYYRDPDGKPAYSQEPRSTPDGRAFVAVRASEDVSFDDEPEPEPASNASTDNPAGARRVLYYRNPMGLPDTSPVPKKDSMGMDYIPVYEGEAEEGNVVKVSPGKLQRTGVRSEPVEQRVVSRPVRVPGTVQLDERRVTVVATRSEAFIDKVEGVTTGDRVRKGQPLVSVYSPEINAAGAQLISNPGFEGSRRRLENLNVPPEAIAEMERTRRVPMAVTWSAPRDGVVLERNAVEGMRAGPGDTLFRIADISTLWVLADVPEYDLSSVRTGQPVSVRVRSAPGRSFVGKVALIYPQVSKETRTTRVRIELPNPEALLLPDMYADVEIATGAGQPVVAVPEDALIDTGARQVVLLDRGEGRFEPRQVKVGTRGNGFVEIREGVEPGDRVVTAANFLIDAESNLKAALQAMASAATVPNEGQKP
ncbi:efflux RND transporter periplasmic adaptor subunit [Enterovirga aerilata]|uniref:Efflux RND transporter periplasmic adaptor subunit n=1 Tax=Enterovirga aerilata TaxID=2730920 RepID=A0A849I917_9HYPH|nr:efflux RND transporter periplasmic adaptor subunit [Enterovirga sp. DB1703]NNM73888.1 efflux RND transporter periplasmic adaptor subunit [Enterovirga sp. DB1703]